MYYPGKEEASGIRGKFREDGACITPKLTSLTEIRGNKWM